MADQESPKSSPVRMALAGLLAWIVPGAGHLYIGERARGLIILIAIGVTFWIGVAIGGVKNTINPTERKLWFAGQICAGGHTLAAMAWGRQVTLPEKADPTLRIAYGRAEDVSVVYTAICGMLNVLVILDVLVRAERNPRTEPARAGPPAASRSTAI